MDAKQRTRSSGLLPEDTLITPIHIIGAGSIGSFTTLALSKMGFRDIATQDQDRVDDPNIGCQLFGPKDKDILKVAALDELMNRLCGSATFAITDKYEDEELNASIIIAAVDNMQTRTNIFEAHVSKTKTLIDCRMGAETLLLYVVPLADTDACMKYAKTLYTSAEAHQEPCTMRSTAYTALIAAGLIGLAVKEVVTNKPTRLKSIAWEIGGTEPIIERVS